MKKVLALLLAITMVIGFNCVAFAAEPTSNIYNLEQPSKPVQTRLISYGSFEGQIPADSAREFTITSPINLKITGASVQDCRFKLKNRSLNIYLKFDNGSREFKVKGGATATTYTLKSNCPPGDYALEMYSDSTPVTLYFDISGSNY